jgi:hypothetical protein
VSLVAARAPLAGRWAGSLPVGPPSPLSFQTALVALPGRRRLVSGAGGPQRPEAHPGFLAWAARGRFTPFGLGRPKPGRSHRRDESRIADRTSATAHNRGTSAGRAASPLSPRPVTSPTSVRPPDLPAAVAVSSLANAPGATTHLHLTSTTPQAGWVQSANHRKD